MHSPDRVHYDAMLFVLISFLVVAICAEHHVRDVKIKKYLLTEAVQESGLEVFEESEEPGGGRSMRKEG